MKAFTNSIRFTARGTFADGTDVSHASPEALAAAIKIKLGMNG